MEATQELNRLSGLFASSAIAGAEAATSAMQQIEDMSDADISEVQESASLFQEVESTTSELRSMLDLLNGIRWLTAGMKSKERTAFEAPLVNTLGQKPAQDFELLAKGPDSLDVDTKESEYEALAAFGQLWNDAKAMAEQVNFLHWEVAFPGVWSGWENPQPDGGFDAVIGNPPWDKIKLQEVEWLAPRSQELALAATAAAREAGIQQLRDTGAPIVDEFDRARDQAETLSKLVRTSGQYPLLSRGDINLYSLFVERSLRLVNSKGIIGLLCQSGIYADKFAAPFFKSISTSGRLAGLFDFENRRSRIKLAPFFPDVDSRLKFCALILGGEQRRFPETRCAYFLEDTESVTDPDRCFPLTPADFARVNPNTGTAPIFRTRRDAEITRNIYENHPVMVDRSQGVEHRAWPVRYQTMFHMTNDSHLFRTAAQLQAEGYYPIEGNRWKKGESLYLPLYQGRMIHQFDHRANSVQLNPENTHNPYLSLEATPEQHADPEFIPQTQFLVPASDVEETLLDDQGYVLTFRDIARPTDARTSIACIAPKAGYGNTLPILLRTKGDLHPGITACQLANFNSFIFDYITRQKVQGTHLNWYIAEQLPVIKQESYKSEFGGTTARDLVLDHVLRLTYTANDMTPFARDLGYEGPPFIWNDDERRHLRARLDALYFHLYGVSKEDAEYILSTFPIVQREDEGQFGSYRTRDLVLAYMSALAAGDTETRIAI